MENVTIGQITNAITLMLVIVSAFSMTYKFIKDALFDKIKLLDNRICKLEELNQRQEHDIAESKEERLILLNGTLACLKGLKEKGCNGPVTQGIADIENYLMKKSHE